MSCLSCYTPYSKNICRHCSNQIFDRFNVKLNIEFRGIIKQPEYFCSIINGTLRQSNTKGIYLIKSTLAYNCLNDFVPENEHLTTQIAKRVFGIHTYPNSLIYLNGKEMGFLTKNIYGDPSIQSQMPISLNYSVENSELRKSIDRFTNAPEIITEKLFRLIVFNYLTGNLQPISDCFMLKRSPYGDYVLGPATNLYNSEIHQQSSIHSEKRISCFIKIGNELGLREQRILKLLSLMAANTNQVKKIINDSFLDRTLKLKYEEYYLSRTEIFSHLRNC